MIGARRSCVLSALVGACLVACAPVGPAVPAAPAAPAAPAMELPGPLLVMEVTNLTDRDVAIGYEYEAADRGSTGGGEGTVPACTVMTESWSEVTGAYALTVDGEVVHEGRLGPGQGDDAALFVRIRVAPDGGTGIIGPVLRAAAPQIGSRPLAGC